MDWKPGFLNFKDQFIYNATEKYIINCCHTVGTLHDNPITQELFNKFKYADIYSQYQKLADAQLADKQDYLNQQVKKVGKIQIMGNGQDQRYIINLFNKRYVNANDIYPEEDFSRMMRYFTSGMNKVYKIKNLESIAIASGSGVVDYFDGWGFERITSTLRKFAQKYPQVRTTLYIRRFSQRQKEQFSTMAINIKE